MPSPPLIAIVDDDGMVRNSLARLLRSMELRVAAFESGESLLAALTAEVACVISDMQMPGMSGLVLQRRLAAERPDLPIIFMTAFPDELTRGRALDAGAGCYLEKPCSAEALAHCLDRALDPERKPK